MSSPRFGEQVDEDPSVCYRHPDRQSWVLCQRCGRTICAECQILAPVGVQCPECVREAGGSVQWNPTGGKPARKRTSSRRPRPAAQPTSGVTGRISELLRPGGEAPPLSWVFAGVAVVLWVVGLFTGNLPVAYLAAFPETAWQIWRFATFSFTYFAAASFSGILLFAISLFFWMLFAPSVERTLGRTRFLTVFAAAAVVGASAQLLFNGSAVGLGAGLFGLFGSYAVLMWSYPPARTQVLVILALNLAINIALGGGSLPLILGGLLAGAGATYLLNFYEDRPRSRPSTPYLIIAAGAGSLAAITVLASVGSF
ncbi:rhomboid family intramembrane serine protease [Homoserinibacter sp. GY 40078]|uniref:rhomboid family intramembrane serine protease n=1 Tax=Homoserinibacter sp. GY 40078 TaxID=2603275 RepID=UPI0011CAC0B6|nr:rhomboid family intramembrane serine protease [Homoserinibacter sp. GY 40078]TXK18891.1 rhomboid family intramembrane serine protease [Homoserinibacter sp. GY 40078]